MPYDVITTREARAQAEGNPLSFLHVIRPEINLPPGTDEHDDAVYAAGAAQLERFAASEAFIRDPQPQLYVYRLTMDGRAQTGLFGCVAVPEYDDEETIRRHEKTRPAKEADRTRHILAQRAHAEPVMLTYRDDEAIDELVADVTAAAPLYNFTAEDGVQHTVWRARATEALVRAFLAVKPLYIADGHHRCKAASRAAHTLRPDAETPTGAGYEFFPAVLFPMSQMHIMAYHRVIQYVPMGNEAFWEALDGFDITPAQTPAPQTPGVVHLYLGDGWHRLVLPPSRRPTVADRLDVARLSEYVLEPILGISDPRTDPAIDFVGGIRGTDALERRVDTGEAALAIAMYPTSIQDLVDVSDAGLLMPPKSTWFEPKLRSGLLVHLFDDGA